MKRSNSVDEYIQSADYWQDELKRLRQILRDTELAEEVKWGARCYTIDGKNIVGLGGVKSYFGLWFHQGALLDDKKDVLINAQEGKTKALRQWRMTAASDIKPSIIKSYVKQAIKLSREGKAIKPDRSRLIVIPLELRNALRKSKGATAAFNSLRTGLQREYAEYISDAKREDTKSRRIEKIMPMIVDGKGLNDRYR